MVSLSVGSIVLVPFPFSDLSQSKLRPALVDSRGRRPWGLDFMSNHQQSLRR